jgi:single-strand DNA-binding protein
MLIITAHGNIGRDPEIKEANGKQVCNFSIAAKTGKDQSTWINCAIWGKPAETAMKFFRKGSAITVSGRGKLRVYNKADGTEAQALQLDVDQFTLPPRDNNQEMPF